MTDHPRSCGANAVGLISAPFRGGSSPLVRGQPPAGLSAISPRGSSPLVRGQRWRHQYRSVHERIIPARAGPTSWLRWSRRVKPDHPRSCGANAHGLAPFVSRSGSSPLVRGQRSGMRLNRLTRRIIPARAGPTYSKRMTKTTATDHPRSCGANSSGFANVGIWRGSSPLVRGQRLSTIDTIKHPRIIPARAGPTEHCNRTRPCNTDHPRSCGANRCCDSGR